MQIDPFEQANSPQGLQRPEHIFSVAALNRLARETLEARFPLLWVGGEISNLTRAASGHLYFTLKDEQAQVRCTMWRTRAQLLAFRPENGMRVDVRARVTLYEPRGDFQLGVESVRQTGVGNLFEAFMRLKDKLAAEGLFDTIRKRPAPRFPRRIGVVTSRAAAAWQDVLATLRRRAPHLEVVLYSAPVQGEGSAAQLTTAVRVAAERATSDRIDALLLVRGGGSIEDLWAFNDEGLARAIHDCSVPVISGVGHETDFTIADFVADTRASTPTGAAEIVSAGFFDARTRLIDLGQSLGGAIDYKLDLCAQRLDRAELRLIHPRDRLQLAREESERLSVRLAGAMSRHIERQEARHRMLEVRLKAHRPDLDHERARCSRAAQRLAVASAALLRARNEHLKRLTAYLQHLAPRAVLARGYSITRDNSGKILRTIAATEIGAAITVELANGKLRATVNSTDA